MITITKTAWLSECQRYRYQLERIWSAAPLLPFIMLNPSTADAFVDDPTIRRCMGFARRDGAGGIVVGNLYAWRATKPDDLWRATDPFGPDNRRALIEIATVASRAGVPIVCAWGANGGAGRYSPDADPINMMRARGARMLCFGQTKNGEPRHPLYVKSDQPFIEFMP